MNADPMMQASEPLTVAAQRVEGVKASTMRVVYVEHAQRIRDEAVAELSDQLAEWEQFADDLARYVGITDPTKATCPEIVMALGNMLKAERASHEGAMADLAALVDVARKAVEGVRNAGSAPFAADEVVIPLARFLDRNHPAVGDGPKPVHIIRRADGNAVHGDGHAFMTCDGPDDWQVADDNEHHLYDEELEYQILACRVVNTCTFGVIEDDDQDESVEVTA